MVGPLGKMSVPECIVCVVLVLFILTHAEPPTEVAHLISGTTGTLAVIVLAIAVFLNTGAIVGVLALVAAYELLRRSRSAGSMDFGPGGAAQPSEAKRTDDFRKYNHMPSTLEEEMVHRMAPLVKSDGPPGIAYQPTLNPQHSAASINAKGIL